MKTIIIKTIRLVAIVFILSLSYTLMAQPPPPPDSGSNSSGNKLNGGGAPIGGGLFILLSLGAAYGGRKWYLHKKESLEE
jgi:hypothetical protein